MIKTIINNLIDASLSKTKGRFLSDKSYGYDTVFFIAKFILRNCTDNKFNKKEQRQKVIDYIEDIFNLKHNTAGAVNYLVETLNLLDFGNVIEKEDGQTYKIVRRDILKFICECPENAYIFLYLLTYQTYKNDGILKLFIKYCQSGNIEEKEKIVSKVFDVFSSKSISIQRSGSNWAKQLVKYSLIILGYANRQNYITRTLKVHSRIVTIEDLSLNIEGTRTPDYLPKKNDYIQKFSTDYIVANLSSYIFDRIKFDRSKTVITQSLASDLADLKLEMIDLRSQNKPDDLPDKQQYIELENNIRQRNPSIQNTFRKSLLERNKEICFICEFSFRKFLIASHIKPYAICDNTYDAINYYNGLLLCPNHDKLFEGAKYMTIEHNSGKIILNDLAKNSNDFAALHGRFIDKRLVNSERKHYLKWHNDQFLKNKN